MKHNVSLENGEALDGAPEIAGFEWVSPEDILTMNDVSLRYHDINNLVQNFLGNKRHTLELVEHIMQTPKVP